MDAIKSKYERGGGILRMNVLLEPGSYVLALLEENLKGSEEEFSGKELML